MPDTLAPPRPTEFSALPVDWQTELFPEVVFFQEGPGIRNWQYRASGIPFVNIRCLVNGRLDRASMNCLDHLEVDSKYRHFLLDAEDLVVSSSGTIGRVAVVAAQDLPCMLNTSVIRMRPCSKRLDRGFLRYFLMSSLYQNQIHAWAGGSVQVNYGPTHLKQMYIALPPPPEQRAIAAVLGALDDKIELNRKLARTLEGIARALFTSWFVDFDPVRRKAAGQPTGLPADLDALFPHRLVDSPIGEVPEGWTAGTLGDLVSLSRDARNPGDHPTEEFDHFSIPAYDAGQMPSKDRGEAIKSQKLAVIADCVLVSKLNPRTPRVWLPSASRGRSQIASTEFLVCTGDKARNVSREFLYCMATSESLIEHLTTHASGTSNSHQRVRPQDFLDYQCVTPPASVLRAFTDAAGPIFERIAGSRAQSDTLAALRDALLPKLISGELRLADAEKIIGREG